MLARDLVLPHLIAKQAAERGDATFIDVVGGPSITYSEFHDEATRWARSLRALGVEADGQVAMMLPVGLDGTLTWMGCAWLNARMVPVNVALRGRMLHYVLDNSGATHLVIAQRYLDRIADLSDALPALTTVVVCDVDEPPDDLPYRTVGRSAFLAGTGDEPLVGPAHHDIAGIFYTSGTTGPSKGVLVPWMQLYQTAAATAPNFGPGEAWYSPMPLTHISGTSPFYAMAIAGARLVLKEAFSTTEFLDDVNKYRCTASLVLGAMTQFLLSLPPSPQDKDTPLWYVGMMPIPPNIEEFTNRFGCKVFSLYNMTELSSPITWAEPQAAPKHRDSCGTVREGYEVRLVDDHDEEVARGEVGELIVRTAEPWMLCTGYHGMPEATAAAWRNGWFHTGDALRRDDEGNFFFVDRLKDAIRRRGENISSAEVEAEVNAHPAVLESAAVPVPSPLGEDEVKVFVSPKPGEELTPESLLEFLVPRMAHYMVPRYVELIDELPKTNTFKVQKHKLRDMGNTASTWDREQAGVVVKRGA